METNRIYVYPLIIRIWHIINALNFVLLVVTGISLHFVAEGNNLIPFNVSVAVHNTCAIILTLNYGLFIAGNIITGNGKYYRSWKTDLKKNMKPQIRFYLSGIFKKEKHPFPVNQDRKFNPLQKISYVMVMFVGMPLIIITGLGLMFPSIMIADVFGISGMALTDYAHYIVGFVLSMFLVIHIYTCTLGEKPGTLFKSIINGYHEEHE